MVEGLGGGVPADRTRRMDGQQAVVEEEDMADTWDPQTDADGKMILLSHPFNQTRNRAAPSLQPNRCIRAIPF